MLTLTGALEIDGMTVYRDVIIDGERTEETSRVHVLPQGPRLVTHDDGWPALWLTRYRGEAGDRDRVGAVLTLALELPIPDGAKETISQAMGREVEPLPIEAFAGTITLAVAGSTESDELLRSISGPKSASLIGNQRASFLVELTADGSALLDEALSRELPVIHVSYELSFHHVVRGVDIRAWADLGAAATLMRGRSAATDPDAGSLLHTVREHQLTGLSIEVLEGAVEQSTVDMLRDAAQQALEAAVVGSLLGPPDADGRPTILDPPRERLDMRIRQGMVVPATLGITGNLSFSLPEEANRIRLVETARETRLDVTVHCLAPFDTSPIDVVTVSWELPATGASDILRFQSGTTELGFRTLRGGDEAKWRYQVKVWLDGRTQPLVMPWVETDETLVVLDLGGVGYVDAEVRLEMLALGQFEAASVQLEHPALRSADAVVLDAEHPTARWSPVVAEHPARPWRARVDWVHRDGSRHEGQWEEQTGRELVLRPPEEVTARSEVMLLTVGSFEDLSLVLCTLRLVASPDEPGPDGSTGEVIELTESGGSAVWMRPSDAAWEYQLVRVRPDGTRETDPWVAGDDPVVVIRDPFAAVVTVMPQLLSAVEGLRLAQVQLRPVGRDTDTTLLTFRPGDAERTWSFRTTAPDELAYEYRPIFIMTDAPRREGSWTAAHSSVLVLTPPT